MPARFFPLIANRLAELTGIPCDATILYAGTDAGVATLSSSPASLPDTVAVLRMWRRALKPGGAVALAGLGQNAFQPLAGLYDARIRSYGLKLADPTSHSPWQRIADAETCHDLLREAGFESVEVRAEQLGFFLQSPGEWWEVVSNSSLGEALSQLSPDQLAQFKVEHVAEICALASTGGNNIWLDVPVIFAVGRAAGAANVETTE